MSALSQPAGSSPAPKPEKTVSIGAVLKQLKPEFPEVTASKIRFLETEGLLAPQRASSNYRKYVQADIDRLRYVLTRQRDYYLPLKVIREELDAMDSREVIPIMKTADAQPMISPEQFRKPAVTRITDAEVAQQSGVELQFVIDLANVGVIKPDQSGFFTADDVQVVTTANALGEFGLDARHLKSLKNTASRQAALISQAVTPIARSKSEGAKERAEEVSQRMSALVVSLHAIMVKTELRDQLS